MQGLIHIYTGDGKGKTTACVGLACRAAGAGLKVCFAQFMKKGNSSELQVLKNIPNLTVVSVVNPYGFSWKMTEEEKKALYEINTMRVKELIAENDYDMLVLDEIISAYQLDLVDRNAVLELLETKDHREIVLSGRNPAEELLAKADYISEIKNVRHPYEKGIQARKGIEF